MKLLKQLIYMNQPDVRRISVEREIGFIPVIGRFNIWEAMLLNLR
jgi:hypothetical protein